MKITIKETEYSWLIWQHTIDALCNDIIETIPNINQETVEFIIYISDSDVCTVYVKNSGLTINDVKYRNYSYNFWALNNESKNIFEEILKKHHYHFANRMHMYLTFQL